LHLCAKLLPTGLLSSLALFILELICRFNVGELDQGSPVYVRSCDSCQRNKTSNQNQIGLLKSLEIPTERFEQVNMDYIATFPVIKENHDAVMVILDQLIKLVVFISIRTDMDIVDTAKKFFSHWYRLLGLPKKEISDRGGRFIRRFWKPTLQIKADKTRNVYKSPS
jgi:hypothetical protein